jgi:rod shape-determining protein MreD
VGVIVTLFFSIPFLTLVALLETTVLPHVRVAGAQPDLMLLVVGNWSLLRGVDDGVIWAFIGGGVLDLLSAGPITASMFALLAVSLLLGVDPSTGTGRRQTRQPGANPFALILSGVLATLAFHLVLLTMLQLSGHQLDWLSAATSVVVPRLVFNLVLIPFVYRFLGWIDRRFLSEGYGL